MKKICIRPPSNVLKLKSVVWNKLASDFGEKSVKLGQKLKLIKTPFWNALFIGVSEDG